MYQSGLYLLRNFQFLSGWVPKVCCMYVSESLSGSVAKVSACSARWLAAALIMGQESHRVRVIDYQ
jgi:hypothetical protein